MIVFRVTTFAFAGILLLSGQAKSEVMSNSLGLGAGILVYQPGVASTSATSGSKTTFGSTYPMLTVNAFYKIAESYFFSPDFSFSPVGRKSPDGQVVTSVSSLSLRFCLPVLTDGMDLHFGPGLLAYQIRGEGGTQDQSNGSGTATFGIPSGTRVSVSSFLDLGIGYQMLPSSRLELSIWIAEIGSSAKRNYSALLGFNTRVF